MKKQTKIKKYYNQKNKLNLKNKKYLEFFKNFVNNNLKEDLDKQGDITTKALIKKNKKIKAAIYAKEKGVVAGVEEVSFILNKNKIKFKQYRKDGEVIKNKEVLMEISGGVKDILKTERLVLNILQRMSGIATLANKFVKKTKNRALVCSTRKTLWGLLDKKAVTVGGGGTHRLNLNDFILIKDNHLEFIDYKLEKQAKQLNAKKTFWEIEVKTENEALWAADLSADAIMFDNFKAKKIKEIIKKINPYYSDIIFESSGNINLKNIIKYSKTKVDIISVGSLTHSAKALDISLDIL